MAVQVLPAIGIGETKAAAAGIIWAANNGGNVINMSFGWNKYSYILDDAVEYAWSLNRLLVAAAGNLGVQALPYPAGYPEVIAVAAHQSDGTLVPLSNWGNDVDLTAPGISILSTHPSENTTCSSQTRFACPDGCTSMAAPFVSGTAALVWAQMAETEPCCATNLDVRQRLVTTADPVGFVKYGQVNACRAVGGSGCD